MRRFLRRLATGLLLPVLLLALVLAALLLAANTGTGQRLIAWGLGEMSDGQVVLSGLSGALPGAPRIARLELRDGEGTWLVVEDVLLDIAPWQLLRLKVLIEAVTARSVVLLRLPPRDETTAAPIRLPMHILLERFFIEDLAIDQVVPGAPRLTIDGSGSVANAADVQATLLMTAPGRTDRYRLEVAISDGRDRFTLALQEAPGGLFAALAASAGVQVPADLDGWRLDARAEGPRSTLALNVALEAKLAVGPLQAAAEGVFDLESGSAAALRLSADVPAMTLAPGDSPGIAWRRMGVKADLTGPFLAPQGNARVDLDGLSAGEATLDRLIATIEGDVARLRFDAELDGLRAPGRLPEAAATVPLRVAGELTADDPALPFRLAVTHPLLDLAAEGGVTARSAQATLTLPDLAALAAPSGVDLAGSARLDLNAAAGGDPQLDATGELTLTRAPGPRPELVQGLLGPAARIGLSVRRDGDAWQVASAQIEGARIKVAAQGRVAGDALALGWTLDLPDLSVLAPGWSGRLEAHGDVAGDPEAPAVVADLALNAGHPDAGRGRVSGRLEARLAEPGGSLDLRGDWAGQPVAINLQAARSEDGGLSLSFGDSRWASVKIAGSLHLASGATLPQGTVRFSAERLADLDPLIAPWVGSDPGRGLAGRLSADVTLTDAGMALIEAEGKGLRLPGPVEIGTLTLSARVAEPLETAQTQATLRLGGFALGQVSGDLSLTAQGTAAALDLTADAGLMAPAGPVKLAAGARLDAPARRLALQRLTAQVRGETLSLLTPAVLDFADGLAVGRLRLGLRPGGTQASVEIAGRVLPRLDLTGTLSGLPLDLVRLVAADPPLAGTLGADLRLTGTLDAPLGRLRAQASGLRLTQGPGRAIPPAQVKVTMDLAPDGAQIDARAETGPRTNLHVHGRIGGRPPFTSRTLALRADGRVDLGLLDPLLTSGGRQLSGGAALKTAITGTLGAPRLDGTLRLTDAALRDRAIGLALTGVEGTLVLAGDTVRVERIAGQSGRGGIELSGSVGVLAPGLPVDLRLVARNARPVHLDQLDIQGDADLRLSGPAAERLTAAGMVRLSRVEVRLPDRLPATVATLQVRDRGGVGRPAAAAPASSALSTDLALDLVLSAPRAVYVRGRGVDAELGGEVQLRGTWADPVISGGFDLLQGEYELVGQVLRFTRGRIGFEGAQGIDPTLDLEARTTAAGSTAILAVLGTASKPRIELRGEPPLPQDEVLSRLLFGVAGGRLSPFQAARIGMAAASLAGIGGGEGLFGLGVLDRLRTGLGLERLSLGTDTQGGATVEGGRQLTDRIYVGARQGARAGEPQGVLRIGITPRIKLEADIGATGGTRAGAAYEREY
jgi:translocation and assembly module TamB